MNQSSNTLPNSAQVCTSMKWWYVPTNEHYNQHRPNLRDRQFSLTDLAWDERGWIWICTWIFSRPMNILQSVQLLLCYPSPAGIWWDNNWEIHNNVFWFPIANKWCDKNFTSCCNHYFGIEYAIKEQHILIPLINSTMVAQLISVQQNMGKRSRGQRKYGQGWRSKRCLKTELCLDQSSNIPIFYDTAFAIAYFVPKVSDIWGIQGSAPQKRGLSNPIFYLWSGTRVRLTPPVRPALIA